MRILERSTRGVSLYLTTDEYQTLNDALCVAVGATRDELDEHLRYDEKHRDIEDDRLIEASLNDMRRLWESW